MRFGIRTTSQSWEYHDAPTQSVVLNFSQSSCFPRAIAITWSLEMIVATIILGPIVISHRACCLLSCTRFVWDAISNTSPCDLDPFA